MKKLILSIVSISLAAVTLISTTYAWFSLNTTVYVDGLELNVTSGENILLSIDGIHWYQNLTADKIKLAVASTYGGYSFNTEEQLIDEDGDIVSDSRIEEIFAEKITLAPVTSSDGKEFTDLYGTTLTANLGKYLSFDLYFACESDSISSDTDVFFYHGIRKELPSGEVINPTRITSTGIDIELKNELKTFDWTTGRMVTHTAKNEAGERNSIHVNPANALRFSTFDERNNWSQIYELDAHDYTTGTRGKGLGSYATNYTYYKEESSAAYMAAYDSTKNAGFTYYNNLRNNKLTALNYEDIPKTVKEFDSYDNSKVCSLKSVFGYETKVRFNYWLEGWDADCFDGIGNTKTTVTLTFTTSSELSYEPIEVEFYTNIEDETPYAEYANANPDMYLSPALAPYVTGKEFRGWAVVKSDGTVDERTYDQTISLKSLVTSYYTQTTKELKLVAMFD